MNIADTWNNRVFSLPIISQLKRQTEIFSHYTNWPDIDDYQRLFKQYKLSVTPVSQSAEIQCFEEQYEPRVYLKGELQTRTENWHDFFNAMVWLRFPDSKKTLNALHYTSSLKRTAGSNRSTLENRITQFDECGAVIVSSDGHLLQLIQQHQWEELFLQHRDRLHVNLSCVVFGHAIFEKALNPYIGMTCHCLLIEDEKLLKQIQSDQVGELDRYISTLWRDFSSHKPEKLAAFPLLGMPGLWPEQDESFYSSNKSYFR